MEAVIKLSSLGDIIHLALLLPMFENIQREWFVDENFSEILKNSPYVSSIHPLPIKKYLKEKKYKELLECLKTLKAMPAYDHIIDAQGLIKSAAVMACLASTRKLGFSFFSAKEGISSLFCNEHCHISYHEHILHRNAKLLSQAYHQPYNPTILEDFLNNKRQQNLIALDASRAAKDMIDQFLEQNGADEKILFVLEASKLNKMYPKEQFLHLAHILQKNNRKFYLLWHESNAHDMAQANPNLICLPKLSLDEVKALLLKMDLVIGGDTGIVHLAFALNISSITLFGNTPIERFALISPYNQALRSDRGKDYDKNDFSIATISPQKIADMAETLLMKVKA